MDCRNSQIFAKEVLYIIAMYINDPKTFQNFSLTCKRCSSVCGKLVLQKKDEFSKKIVIKKMRLITIFSQLPNKWKHGCYTQWYNNGIIRKKGMYENGHMTGMWEWKHYTGKMAITGSYSKSKKCGIWNYFDTNGIIKKVCRH